MKIFTIVIFITGFIITGCNDDNATTKTSTIIKKDPALPLGLQWGMEFNRLSENIANLYLEKFDTESKLSFYSIEHTDDFLTGMDSYNLITDENGFLTALNTAQFFKQNEQRELIERYEEIKSEISAKYNTDEKKEKMKNNRMIFKCLKSDVCGVMYSIYKSDSTTVLVRAHGIDDQNGMLQVLAFPKDGQFDVTF